MCKPPAFLKVSSDVSVAAAPSLIVLALFSLLVSNLAVSAVLVKVNALITVEQDAYA